ncbi:MAG: TPM domain-containing protein [Candidatus Izemoplasmatales bacterium]|nr:TPM domain-containing protein [Candidatus Izemoplasmatales bacterium]
MKAKIIYLLIISFLISALIGCGDKNEYPDPTRKFYVNDFADKLSPAVESTIVREAERLYEYSTDEVSQTGIQVVFATFAVESEADIASFYLSDLYNQWEIGTDDLGILIVFYYVGNLDDPDSPIYTVYDFMLGFSMEQYVSPIDLGNMFDETIKLAEDEQLGTAHLLYEILQEIYWEIYDTEFTYDLDYYANTYLPYYDEYADYDDIWGWILYIILSPSSSWWEKGILALIGFAVLGTGGGLARNIGGGGRSGGMGLRRRK